MKKLSILMFFSALLFLTGCEEVETPDLGESTQWIQIEKSEYSITENSADPLTVQILYAADTNSSDITVNFEITASDPNRFTYTPTTGSVVIPAGEFTADIVIDPVDNFATDGDAEIILEISTDSGIPLGIAGEGIYNNSAVITIIDDDCPIDINAMSGTYNVVEQFTAGPNAPLGLVDFFGEAYQVEINALPGDVTGTKMIITNSPGYNVYFEEGTVITFRTCTKTFDFDAGNPLLALFDYLAVVETSYDDTTFQITANGELGNYGSYQFLLTKQ